MKEIRLALSVLSRRKDWRWLTNDELRLLGYVPDYLYEPAPDEEDILDMAEKVLLNAFEYLYSSADQAVYGHEESFHRE